MAISTSLVTAGNGAEFLVKIWTFTPTTAAIIPSGDYQMSSSTVAQNVNVVFVAALKTMVTMDTMARDEAEDIINQNAEEIVIVLVFF